MEAAQEEWRWYRKSGDGTGRLKSGDGTGRVETVQEEWRRYRKCEDDTGSICWLVSFYRQKVRRLSFHNLPDSHFQFDDLIAQLSYIKKEYCQQSIKDIIVAVQVSTLLYQTTLYRYRILQVQKRTAVLCILVF